MENRRSFDRESIFESLKGIVAGYLRYDESKITLTSHMMDDLAADSLSLVEIGFRISEFFEIPIIEPDEKYLIFDNLVGHIQELGTESHST